MTSFAALFRWLRNNVCKIDVSRVCGIVVLVSAAIVYLPYLNNPLVFDDFAVINSTGFLDHIFHFYFAPRWFPYATLAHTYLLTDGSIRALRIGNVVLHAANVLAVFALIQTVLAAAGNAHGNEQQHKFQRLAWAFFGASLFAVHPVAVYAVGYLVQRTILLSTFFMLLMLIAYLRWLSSGRRALWIWSAVWYLFSVFSKEHSIMAPAVALVLTLVLRRPSASLMRELVPPFLTYTVIALVVISMMKGILGTAYEIHAPDMLRELFGEEFRLYGYPLSVLTQSGLYFKYMYLWIIPDPNQMSIDIRVPLAASFQSWPHLLAAAGFLLYPFLTIKAAARGGRIGVLGWGLTYPWLMFVTELTTVRVQEPFVLYREYLWFPVLGIVAAVALSRFTSRMTLILSFVMICALVPLSWSRLHAMSDPVNLWDEAARQLKQGNEPGAGRIFYNRAEAYRNKGQRAEALADLDRVVRLHPRLAQVYDARARVHFEMKQFQEALRDLNASISITSDRADRYVARGMVLRRLNRDDEAMNDFEKSCSMQDVIGCYLVKTKP